MMVTVWRKDLNYYVDQTRNKMKDFNTIGDYGSQINSYDVSIVKSG